jgi:hypothetical protein
MRREGRCHVRRQNSSDTGTATTPTTTDTNTNKINPSSATDLTSPGPVVGVRNDGQHLMEGDARTNDVVADILDALKTDGIDLGQHWATDPATWRAMASASRPVPKAWEQEILQSLKGHEL